MKRPLYLLNVWVYENEQKGRFGSLEVEDREGRVENFYRFYVVPRKDDVINIAETYYRVLEVQFEGYKKSFSHPTFYSEGMLFVTEIGNKEEYKKKLIAEAKKVK